MPRKSWNTGLRGFETYRAIVHTFANGTVGSFSRDFRILQRAYDHCEKYAGQCNRRILLVKVSQRSSRECIVYLRWRTGDPPFPTFKALRQRVEVESFNPPMPQVCLPVRPYVKQA